MYTYTHFTDRARNVMWLANKEAERFNHEYIGTEHVLLGLAKQGDGVAAEVLKSLNVDFRAIRLELEKLIQSGPGIVTIGKLPQTPRAKKVIEYAMIEAHDLGHNYVGTEHILLGVMCEEQGVAAQVMLNLGLKLENVREKVLQVLGQKTADDIRLRMKEQPVRTRTEDPSRESHARGDARQERIDEMVRQSLAALRGKQSFARQLFTELPWSLAISALVGLVSDSWIVFGLALVLLVMRDVVQAIWPRP